MEPSQPYPPPRFGHSINGTGEYSDPQTPYRASKFPWVPTFPEDQNIGNLAAPWFNHNHVIPGASQPFAGYATSQDYQVANQQPTTVSPARTWLQPMYTPPSQLDIPDFGYSPSVPDEYIETPSSAGLGHPYAQVVPNTIYDGGNDFPVDCTLQYMQDGGHQQEQSVAVGDGEKVDGEESYARILYHALRNVPDNKMTLKELYKHVEEHSRKARESTDGGWRNSVRHNLSMNVAFERVDSPSNSGKKKSSWWKLSHDALSKGSVESTTRFRKAPKHPRQKCSKPAAPKRQQSGAKGGKATKAAAARRKEREMKPVGFPSHGLPLQHSLRSDPVASPVFQPQPDYLHQRFGGEAQMTWQGVTSSSLLPVGSDTYYGHEDGPQQPYLQQATPQEQGHVDDIDLPSRAMNGELPLDFKSEWDLLGPSQDSVR